ncbi:MAG TPA: Rrf2 family transcriptional regulator [Candidatus Hydrogenedentes bacterium]|jgi:Rrf2 family protein|nr:Rrf2 family transcriptional regulator [Candidatus Hydrogenedentota bacterium]HQB03605.1 Rrf2 family transcriptional regulator [Candidatus Hydrogenedentota bacterium]
MRVSKKSDYALRVLVYLAEKIGAGPVSIRTLARLHDIPYRFLQQIVLDMKEQGWIMTLPGREGGIQLAKEPREITMGEVVRCFDGVLAPIACVSITQNEACSQEAYCKFRRTFLEIRNHTAQRMDKTTLHDLTFCVPLSQEEVFGVQFKDGAGI